MPTTPPQNAGQAASGHHAAQRAATGVPSANSGHCTTIPGTVFDPVGTCDTLCGRAWHCSCHFTANSPYPPLLRNPRQAWAQPSDEVRTLTRARPTLAEPSAHRQVKHRGRYLPQQPPRRPQESPGRWHDLCKAKGPPRTTATPGAMLSSALQCTFCSNRLLHSHDSGVDNDF